MGLSVTVLGCSGSYSAPGVPCTGFLVESDSTRVWLDAGSGTLANLQRHCQPADLDAVVITHQHVDHWVDLAVAFTAFRHYIKREPLPIYGTADTWLLARTVVGHDDLSPTFKWRVITDKDQVTIGDQQWRFSQTDHPVETLAPRVDSGGRSFAFSADTASGWSFDQLGDGIDLALCEATFLEADRPADAPHLSAQQAGAMAAASGVGSLLLTHLAPGSNPEAMVREASNSLGRPVEVVDVNRRYEV